MKNWLKYILVLMLYTISFNALATLHVLDKIAVIVNDNIILDSDIEKAIQNIMSNNYVHEHLYPQNNNTLRDEIIEILIMEHIIMQLASSMDIHITDIQVEEAINNIAIQNNITIDQLQQKLEQDNVNYDTYRMQIRKQMIISEICNHAILSRIVLSPKEIDTLKQQILKKNKRNIQYNISHILISLPDNHTEYQKHTAHVLAKSLIQQIKNNISFDQLKINQNNHKIVFNHFRWKTSKEIPSLFETYLNNATKNSVFGPICSNAGLHIIKINDLIDNTENTSTKEWRIRHILIYSLPENNDSTHILKQLQDISQQIKNGQIDFATAAKQSSQDQQSALQGGDLGWKTLDYFDPKLQDILIHLKKGEISIPVRSAQGWHIMQLIDVRRIKHTEFMQQKQACNLLLQRKFTRETHAWIQEQRALSYIKIIYTKK